MAAQQAGRSVNPRPVEGKLAVVFGGGIGDMALFLDALSHIAARFSDDGREAVLVTKPANVRLLEAARPDILIRAVEFDLGRFRSDSRYRRAKKRELKAERFDVSVSPLQAKYAELVSLVIMAKRRLEVREEGFVGFTSPWYWLNQAAYNERLITGGMAFSLFRDACVYLGCQRYETSIVPFVGHDESSSDKPIRPYCVIAPTASETARFWPADRFGAVVEHILRKTSLDVVFCGGHEGDGLFEQITKPIPSTSTSIRAIDMMGSTGIGEWLELLRNAEFCFGNDSASIHLASHLGVPSVCVGGAAYYGYCHPYVVEQDGGEVPVSIYKPRPCFRCYLKDYRRCAGNPACKKQVCAGGIYLCVEDVTVDMVLSEVDFLIRRLGLARGFDEI